jgi:multidrug resistance efflux pump
MRLSQPSAAVMDGGRPRSCLNLSARLASQRRQIKVSEEALALSQVSVDDTVIRAPFAGVIIAKAAQPGEMISPISAGGGFTRTGIGTIVDMDSLEIEVDVNENFIGRVQPAQPVEATLNAYPDWKIPAEVIAIIPTADRSKATVKVRIAIKLKDARIVPDMGVRVAFLDEKKADAAPTEPPKPSDRIATLPIWRSSDSSPMSSSGIR